MKKIIALILVLASLACITSCDIKDTIGQITGNNNNQQSNEVVDRYNAMFASSAPTKAETVVTETMSSVVLESVVSITTGTVDGKKASVLTSDVQSLNDIDIDKFRNLSLNLISESSTTRWYYEGKGVSTNRGKSWDKEGTDFAPKAGSLSINLDPALVENMTNTTEGSVEYLTFEVSKANAAKVLPAYVTADFAYDCVVVISSTGGRISGVEISYSIESHELGDMDAYVDVETIEMVLKATYSYDLQEINFD